MKTATYISQRTQKATANGRDAADTVVGTRMRAVAVDEYGDFDRLQIRERVVPQPGKGEVLVRVDHAALHAADCFGVRGAPILMRAATGWLRPKHGIPGYDLAGIVAAVGEGVTDFAVGDEVFGGAEATCAEYAIAKATHLAPKPVGVSFEQAAAMPTSGLAALHALRDVAKVQPGQRVLVNGASGGVGHFAIQIAKSMGAEVTGVCSTRNLDMVRALGADHVIDYTKEDFADGSRRYDVVLDNVENRPLAEIRRALTKRGTLILNSGTGATGGRLLWRLIKPLIVTPFVSHKLRRYLSVPKQEDLALLGELAVSGAMHATVSRVVTLADTPDALRHIATGRSRGKVVVKVG